MTNVLNTMKVELTIVKINMNKSHSCDVRISVEINNKMEKTILKDCFLSGLAKHRLLDEKNEKFQVGKLYSSKNNSKVYADFPLALKRTCNKTTGEEIFIVQVVNEGRTTKNIVASPKGKEIQSYTFSTIPPNKWFRYNDYYAKNFAAYQAREKSKQPA